MSTIKPRLKREQTKFKRVQFGRYDARVAGLQHAGGHRYWPLMDIGNNVYLERQPDNKHDSNAIAVFVWDGAEYQRVGYVERAVALKLAPELDRGFEVEALVVRRDGAAEVYNQVTVSVELYAYLPETAGV